MAALPFTQPTVSKHSSRTSRPLHHKDREWQQIKDTEK